MALQNPAHMTQGRSCRQSCDTYHILQQEPPCHCRVREGDPSADLFKRIFNVSFLILVKLQMVEFYSDYIIKNRTRSSHLGTHLDRFVLSLRTVNVFAFCEDCYFV